MSSSQAETESMVGGLWSSWFKQLGAQVSQLSAPAQDVVRELSVHDLFCEAEADFFQKNLYELANAVKARIYAPTIWQLEFDFEGSRGRTDPWHVDLMAALSEIVKNMCRATVAAPATTGTDSGGPLAPAMALQQRYESG